VNGLGVRSGNTPLEEIALVLARHGSALGLQTRISIDAVEKVSRLVAELTGVPVPAGKAVVGENVRRGGTSPCCASTPRSGG
jgi:2-isopropylmalate synthase